MGGMWFGPNRLTGTVGDLLGHKAGLALTHDEVAELLDDVPAFSAMWHDNVQGTVRVRSEEFESLFGYLLERVGRAKKHSPLGPVSDLLRAITKLDPETAAVGQGVFEVWYGIVREHGGSGATGPIDLTPLVEQSIAKFGQMGGVVALELIDAITAHLDASPYSRFRAVDWADKVALKDLFDSEGLAPAHGEFIDQRFIDYLCVNWSKLGTMNWRKFEGLTAEFFHRAGYLVELGPGRGDDGVDVRIWSRDGAVPAPPLLLVQCKRTRNDVEKVVVKALWSDILAEKAKAGLIVTTARLSPGAEAVCQARGYPISQANTKDLRKWLNLLRTPGTGIFLGE